MHSHSVRKYWVTGLRTESASKLNRKFNELGWETRQIVFEILTAEQIRQVEETFQISDINADSVHHRELFQMPRELDLFSNRR